MSRLGRRLVRFIKQENVQDTPRLSDYSQSIDIAVEREEIDRMSLLTDEEHEPYGHDFSNANSPEAREFYKRGNEEPSR